MSAEKRRLAAMVLTPIEANGFTGPQCEETMAPIRPHFGEKGSAIAGVQHLLRIPYGGIPVTPALLRLDPDWDNLRGDPRFEKLCRDK
jgi:hypothetical protein